MRRRRGRKLSRRSVSDQRHRQRSRVRDGAWVEHRHVHRRRRHRLRRDRCRGRRHGGRNERCRWCQRRRRNRRGDVFFAPSLRRGRTRDETAACTERTQRGLAGEPHEATRNVAQDDDRWLLERGRRETFQRRDGDAVFTTRTLSTAMLEYNLNQAMFSNFDGRLSRVRSTRMRKPYPLRHARGEFDAT